MFLKISTTIFILTCITLCNCSDSDWYKTASFYQIYPQTFYDGGGGDREGFGTLRGIQEKIPYFLELGVDCLWLTPVFKSSYNAFGYDITDYMDIDSRYGTKTDFSNLIKAVHESGLKIIVDFVPNHCGYEHEFFQKSIEKNPQYDNWFVWAEGRGVNKTKPPSNWQRIGGGLSSAWNRKIKGAEISRSEYFYAQFYETMPDFNLREPAVAEYWKEFLKFWLNFGLDGFRVDAISHGFEVQFENGTYPDEEIVEGVESEFDFGYLNHTYTQDLPELFEMIYDWREVLDSYNDTTRIFMTESYSKPETIMKFYRNAEGTRKGAQLPFNFQLIKMIRNDSTADTFVNAINEWFDLLPEGEVTNWAIGNHDQSRVATKYGIQRVDIFNTLCTMLPGTSVTYNGEEIGMEDSCVNYDSDHNNPGHRCNATHTSTSDARYRTPMQWSNATNGGFTNSSKSWLPIGDKYETVNVEAQRGVDGSHLEVYKLLQKMRKHKAIRESELSGFKVVKFNTNSFGFKRELDDPNQQSLLILLNYGKNPETVNLKDLNLINNPKLITFTVVSGNSQFKIGDQIDISGDFSLNGYEAIVASYNNASALGCKIFIVIVGIFISLLRK